MTRGCVVSAETTLIAALVALAFDAVVGYPDAIYRRIGHPVTWIGALIDALDRSLNRETWSPIVRRLSGVVALGLSVAIPVSIATAISWQLSNSIAGAIALGLLAATLIAGRSLYTHVRDVAEALERQGLVAGRAAVSRIVGRDSEVLDEPGVARAAIESLAENASDGVVAPLFWFLLLGLPGLVAYKAINTADSMIGHLTARHRSFGWAAARLDDLVNLPASRLSGLFFALAALMLPHGSPHGALTSMLRDAAGHRSPNAGWPEAAMAGALGLKLNGPRRYGGVMTSDAYMGNGRRDANAADIRRALRLALLAWAVMAAALLATWFSVRG